MPTLPTSKKENGQATRLWEQNRKQAEKPFQEFIKSQKVIRAHEGSVGWQLRNGAPTKKTATTAEAVKATWKPPAPGDKLWRAGKVWRTAPRPHNLERQKHELLKIYETSSALLQECEHIMAYAP
jgi:hypothetical protein